MRFSYIQWRVSSVGIYNIKLTNKKGEASPKIGNSTNITSSITLKDVQIAKITVYTDNDNVKGIKIEYRDGES